MRWLELIGFLMIVISIGGCSYNPDMAGISMLTASIGFLVFLAGRFQK